jgi:sulfatase modifying factor 1
MMLAATRALLSVLLAHCLSVGTVSLGLLLLVTACAREAGQAEVSTTSGGKIASVRGNGRRNTRDGTARSCEALAATCGASGTDDCCKSLLVSGGTFKRSYDGVDFLDPSYPATVSDFYLDKYEITVARFRVFVNAGMGTQGSPPGKHTGANPRIANSGWNSTWNIHLPADTAALKAALKCHPTYQTWTDTPGSNENKPVNCLDWYTAFAFCAWDGGRMATEAEWNYAASGGSEQRYYPWSSPAKSTTISNSYAVYCGDTCKVENVGSKSPRGDGKWGQSDLGGNAWEWTLDWSADPYPMPCHDCAVVTPGSYRTFRSGSNDDIAATLRSAVRHVYYPEYHGVVGSRCARNR